MKRRTTIALTLLLMMGAGRGFASGQAAKIIDRVAARIENDIILLSDIEKLSRYQRFIDAKTEDETKLLEHLIDQWIVRNEATAAGFTQPSKDDVEKSLGRIKRSFSSPEEYAARLKNLGLTEEGLRKMVQEQLFLSNYLDARFRPSTQIEEKVIQNFYNERVVPRAKANGQQPPTMDAAREFIQEVLVLQAINEQADRWLKESRTRLRVVKMATGVAP